MSVPFRTNLKCFPSVVASHVGNPIVTSPATVPIKTSLTAVVIVCPVVTNINGLPHDGSHVAPVHCITCDSVAPCWAIPKGDPPDPSPVNVASVVTVPPPPDAVSVNVSPESEAVTPVPSLICTSSPVLEFRRYKVALTSVHERFVAPPLAHVKQSHADPSHRYVSGVVQVFDTSQDWYFVGAPIGAAHPEISRIAWPILNQVVPLSRFGFTHQRPVTVSIATALPLAPGTNVGGPLVYAMPAVA